MTTQAAIGVAFLGTSLGIALAITLGVGLIVALACTALGLGFVLLS